MHYPFPVYHSPHVCNKKIKHIDLCYFHMQLTWLDWSRSRSRSRRFWSRSHNRFWSRSRSRTLWSRSWPWSHYVLVSLTSLLEGSLCRGMDKGTLPPVPPPPPHHPEMLKSIFLLQRLSTNLSRGSIYASFWENVVSFWGFAPDPHRVAAPGPCWGLSSFRPPHCPPLVKILLAPMSRCTLLKVVMLVLLCMASNIKQIPTVNWTAAVSALCMNSNEMNSVVVTTASTSNSLINQALVISLKLNDGSRLVTSFKFIYRLDPRFANIEPRYHLLV